MKKNGCNTILRLLNADKKAAWQENHHLFLTAETKNYFLRRKPCLIKKKEPMAYGITRAKVIACGYTQLECIYSGKALVYKNNSGAVSSFFPL